MPAAAVILAAIALQVAAGLLATGSKRRRLVAFVLTYIAVPLPFFLPADLPALRAVFALEVAMGCMRSTDLARDKTVRSAFFRVQHVLTPFDTRRISTAPRALRFGKLAGALLYGVVAAAAIWAVIVVSPALDPSRVPASRWLFGLIATYAFTDFAYGLVAVGLRAGGLDTYELHRAPALSRSVQEFWGERWNRTVSAWFREHLLLPLARRRSPLLGVVASFAASAVLHAYLVVAAVGVGWGLVMFGYFALQAAFVFAERGLRIATWPRPAARAWTVILMVASSPLFIEPGLRSIGL